MPTATLLPVRRFATSLILVLTVSLLWATSRRFALHSDEMTVLLHAQRFWEGNFASPGRPGLLWLLLAPLSALPESELVLRAGRVAAFLFATATVGLLAQLGAPPGERLSALPLLPLLCAGTWLTHGVELRTDTVTTPLTLLALMLLWGPRTRRSVPLAALCMAGAVLISQKSAYNVLGLAAAWLFARPTPAGMPSWRLRDAALAAAVGAVAIGLWYVAMSVLSGRGAGFVAANLSGAARTAFGDGVTQQEKLAWLGEAVTRGPLLWACGLAGLLPASFRAKHDGRALASGVVALGMLAIMPLHRGFFPYYIGSIEPFLALPAAAFLASLAGLARPLPARAALLALPLLIGAREASSHLRAAWDVTLFAQLETARAADGLFEEPVAYIGGIHMVPGDRELAGYLTAEVRNARRRVDPDFVATMIREQKPLYFVHEYMTRDTYLRPAEKRLLHATYVPYRHNVYVHAGRASWEGGSLGGGRDVTLLVDGPYTVRFRGAAPSATVDGRPVEEGQILTLFAGPHRVEVGPSDVAGEIWLCAGRGTDPEPVEDHVDLSTFPKDRTNSRARYQQYDRRAGEWDLLSPPGSSRHQKERRRHQQRLAALDTLGTPLTRITP